MRAVGVVFAAVTVLAAVALVAVALRGPRWSRAQREDELLRCTADTDGDAAWCECVVGEMERANPRLVGHPGVLAILDAAGRCVGR